MGLSNDHSRGEALLHKVEHCMDHIIMPSFHHALGPDAVKIVVWFSVAEDSVTRVLASRRLFVDR